MVRWCWVHLQCRVVLLIWIIIGQGPNVLAVGAGGVVWTFFSLLYHFFFSFSRFLLTEILSPSTVKPKTTNQPKAFKVTQVSTSRTVLSQIVSNACTLSNLNKKGNSALYFKLNLLIHSFILTSVTVTAACSYRISTLCRGCSVCVHVDQNEYKGYTCN